MPAIQVREKNIWDKGNCRELVFSGAAHSSLQSALLKLRFIALRSYQLYKQEELPQSAWTKTGYFSHDIPDLRIKQQPTYNLSFQSRHSRLVIKQQKFRGVNAFSF